METWAGYLVEEVLNKGAGVNQPPNDNNLISVK
jgi:hypothetical protein